MPDALTLVGLLLGGGVLFAVTIVLIDAFIREPYYAIYALMIAYMGDIVFDAQQQITVAGITIWSYDVTGALLVAAAIARLLRRPGRELGNLVLIIALLGGIALLGVVRGLPLHGVQETINEFREWWHYLAAILYFSTVPFDRTLERKIVRTFQVAAVVLVTIVLLRWVQKLTGVPLGPLGLGARAVDRVYGEGDSIRVIHANDTFVLLQCGILYLMRWRQDVSRNHLRFAGLMLFMAVALSHRTVWVSMIVALALIFLENRRLAGRLVAVGAVGMVLAIGALLATAGADGLSRTAVDTSPASRVELGEGALAGNTFVWRLEGWVALIEQVDWTDPVQPYIGEPFGSGYERRLNGQTVDISPHSGYVVAFLRMGAFGLALFVGGFVTAILELRRRGTERDWLSDNTFMVLLVAQMVFLITYNPDLVHGMVLGLAMGSIAAPPERRTFEDGYLQDRPGGLPTPSEVR